MFLQNFKLPSPQIENKENLPGSGNGNEGNETGSGCRGGEQEARLPRGMMLPPIWPLSNMRNDLFEAPTKIVNGDSSVENVLGRFEHADRLSNCLGVDYMPPAPGLIQIPQLLNPSISKPPPGPQQNITVSHAYLNSMGAP